MIRSNNPSMVRGGTPAWRSLGRKVRWSAIALTLTAAGALHAVPPELATQGNQIIVKSTGERVRLVGANFTGLEKNENYDRNFLNSLEILKGTWKANIIRLAVSDTLWFHTNLTTRAAYRAKIDGIINRAGELDIYVILDLHKYKQALPSATTFWTDAANTYKTKEFVLFGLLNEPHSTSWSVWRDGDSVGPGMQDLLETVRAQGANNIVVVGGLDYAYDLRGVLPGYNGLPNGYALVDTPSGNGIVYDAHVYPWKPEIQLRAGNAALVHPVLLGEFGHPSGTTVDFISQSFEVPETWMPRMMDWINTNNLHWVGWNFSEGSDPAMLTDWSYEPTPYWGDYARSHMQSYAEPTALRVVGGTIIGTPGTRLNPTSGVITDDRRGAVAPFSNTYAYYFDAATASGGWTGLDLGTPTRITQIRYMPAKLSTGSADMVGGVFQGSNDANFSTATTLHTITTAPDGTFNGNIGTYTTAAVSDTGTYRYVRYMGPSGKHSRVAAVRFFTGDDSGPGVNDDVIIIDNGGTGSEVHGDWKNITSGTKDFHGSYWVHDDNAGKGDKWIRYTPTIMKDGLYEVFTIWSAKEARCPAVPYTITHGGAASPETVYRDQTANGSSWQSLGTYYFEAGTTGNVLVSNTGTTGPQYYVTADAVKFVYKPEVTIIMDKGPVADPGIVTIGGWSTSNSAGYYGDTRSYHDGDSAKGTKSVRFTPDIEVAGQYKVYVWWTSHSNRATDTPMTVYHSGGSQTFDVNQEVNGGQWNELPGTYTFAAGANTATGSVLISNDANEYVVVDAVRFLRVGN